MPLELRKIFLTGDELIDGLKSFRRVNEDFLPQGDIVSTKINEDLTVGVSVRAAYRGGTQDADFTVGKDDLLEILIRFCIENNIPIPRQGAKKVIGVSNRLGLEIRVGK